LAQLGHDLRHEGRRAGRLAGARLAAASHALGVGGVRHGEPSLRWSLGLGRRGKAEAGSLSPVRRRSRRARGTRTPNRRFWRPVLYQLSYCPPDAHASACRWEAGSRSVRTPERSVYGTPRAGAKMGPVSQQTTHTRPRISRRIGSIAESATLAVDARAKALKAQGRPVIGFGAGEPDFATPDYIVEAAVEAARNPVNHRYSPAGGLPDLKAAIVAKTRRDSGYAVEPANVLVTNGGKQAVYNTFAALLDPGDQVILPTPAWTTYPEAIRLAGGEPVEVFAGTDQGYLVTVE